MRLEQTVGNWGKFEPQMTRPAGRPAVVEYRFRNGEEVLFEVHRLDLQAILDDVRTYLKSNPRELASESRMADGNETRVVVWLDNTRRPA